MQITTLNKIINIFLVGAFSFSLLLLSYFLQNPSTISELQDQFNKINAPTITIFVTFTLFTFPILLGVIVDAAASLLFSYPVKKLPKYKLVRYLFFVKERHDQFEALKEKFKSKFDSTEKYNNLNKDDNLYRTYSVAIFFNTASKENIEWVVQHYSYYLLSINYLFICCCVFISTFFISFNYLSNNQIRIIVATFIYLFINQAITKFLYAHECSYRHSAIVLCEEKSNDEYDENVEKT